MEELDELLGSGTEEAVYKQGYSKGYEEGYREGQEEGWNAGLKTGTDIGFELGKYKGFALAVQEHLSQDSEEGNPNTGDSSHTKSLKLCDKIIKLVDQFKLENVTSIHDATSQIRTQYNVLKMQLGIAEEQQGETIPGQKFTF